MTEHHAHTYAVLSHPSGLARLMRGDEELLVGPRPELLSIAGALNVDPPKRTEIAARLRLLLQQTRGCSFCPGPGLRSIAGGGGS